MRGLVVGLWLLLVAVQVQALVQPLEIGIRGHTVRMEIFSLFAHAGESLRLELPGYDTNDLTLIAAEAVVAEQGVGFWSLTAPDRAGLYQLELYNNRTEQHTRLNLFVGRALDAAQNQVGGYHLGAPPPGNPLRPEFYVPPTIYYEVREEIADTRVSPHFTLRQFLCKQESGDPKFVVMTESLLLLLENLILAVRQAGFPVETFGVISGYRTPWYNQSIGNVANSRHVYGDAMDLFVDLDNDGAMDDLNGDGSQNAADVDLLYQIIDSVKQQSEDSRLSGGIGRYYKAQHHGGFVHIDTRGYAARW